MSHGDWLGKSLGTIANLRWVWTRAWLSTYLPTGFSTLVPWSHLGCSGSLASHARTSSWGFPQPKGPLITVRELHAKLS